jgi:hypothetical protein
MIRRRLNYDIMKDEMDSIIEYHMIPCEFRDAGDFVAEACDMFTYNFLEDLDVSSEDKDGLYYYAVDVFGKYLVEVYNEKCGDKDDLNESVGELSRKVKILKKYTEEMLSEKPWFDGLDIKISSYQTSHKNKNGDYYLVSVPILIFRINTKNISDNKRNKLDSEIQDIVNSLFNSLFPDDEYENPEALWDLNFDFHL